MTTSMDSVYAEFTIAERCCAIQAIMREKSRSQLESRASMTSKRMPPADQTQTLYPRIQATPPSQHIYIYFSFFLLLLLLLMPENGKLTALECAIQMEPQASSFLND